MAKRKKIPYKKSKRQFTQTALRTHSMNTMDTQQKRGGWRL